MSNYIYIHGLAQSAESVYGLFFDTSTSEKSDKVHIYMSTFQNKSNSYQFCPLIGISFYLKKGQNNLRIPVLFS